MAWHSVGAGMVSHRNIYGDGGRTPLPSSTVVLIPLDEMVRRIEAIRAEESPDTCLACGTKTARPLAYKVCSHCGVTKGHALFGVDSRSQRPRAWCRQCDAEALAVRRRQQVIRRLRRIS
jgi:hypothetical protein